MPFFIPSRVARAGTDKFQISKLIFKTDFKILTFYSLYNIKNVRIFQKYQQNPRRYYGYYNLFS